MHFDKKQLEVLLMQYFRESYSDFPKGILKPSESPDFIVTFKNRQQLGIELTRLFPQNANIPDETELKKIGFREHFIEMVKDLVEKSVPHKLFVKFLFSEENDISAEREIIISVRLAGVIRQVVQNKKADHFFSISIPENQLPDGVTDVLIINHPELDFSVWERSNNLGISNNIVADIRKAIHKKDEKLGLYQKKRLNYYWLLIFTDRLRGVRNYNLAEKVVNHKFISRFQHVFLFDLIKSDIYELI